MVLLVQLAACAATCRLALVERLAPRPCPEYVLDATCYSGLTRFQPIEFVAHYAGPASLRPPAAPLPYSFRYVRGSNPVLHQISASERELNPPDWFSVSAVETNFSHSYHKCQQPFATLFPTCLNDTPIKRFPCCNSPRQPYAPNDCAERSISCTTLRPGSSCPYGRRGSAYRLAPCSRTQEAARVPHLAGRPVQSLRRRSYTAFAESLA